MVVRVLVRVGRGRSSVAYRVAAPADREHFESLEAGWEFKLIGSGEATGDIDAVLSEIRADDRREAERRQGEMS